MTEQTPEKKCTKCGEKKPATLEYFSRHTRSSDGFQCWCKTCERKHREANKDKIAVQRKGYREANKDKIAVKDRRYYEANKDEIAVLHRAYVEANKDSIRNYRKAWREANRDRLRARKTARKDEIAIYMRAWRKANRGKLLAYDTAWRKANPGRHIIYHNKRRARKLALPDDWTTQDIKHCLDYWNHQCAVCNSPLITKHADHWIPITYRSADNPGTVPTNMIYLCQACNNSKYNKLPSVWLREVFNEATASQIEERIQAYFETVRQR